LAKYNSSSNSLPLDADQLLWQSSATEGRLWKRQFSVLAHQAQTNEERRVPCLVWCPANDGAKLSIPITVSRAGRYELTISHVSHPSGGKFMLRSGGRVVVPLVETYSEAAVCETLKAIVVLDSGGNTLEFVLKGRSQRADGFQLAIEALNLSRIPASDDSDMASASAKL
jgi:hypothetical protein